MKLRVVQLFLFVALLGLSFVQAVVVGGSQQLANNNRNGYRYNGPAHKYLPAEEPHQQQQEQQHHQKGQGEGQPQAFSGPFNKEYYEGQRQQEQQEENSWQALLSQKEQHHQQQQGYQQPQQHQQQHQQQQGYQQHGLGHQQHHQINQISGYQPHQEGSRHQQGLGHQHQLSGGHQEGHHHIYQQQHQQQQQGLGHHQVSGGHSYEPVYSQQHQGHQGQQHHQTQGGSESWNPQPGHNSNQQRGESWQQQGAPESWNSIRGQGAHQQQQQQQTEYSQQRGESWHPGHNEHSQQQRGESWQHLGGGGGSEIWNSHLQRGETRPASPQSHQQQHHHRGDNLWHPISESDLEKLSLPSAEAHASSHKDIAKPGRLTSLVPSYTLSSDAEHDRFIGMDSQDTRLLGQALPEAYRKQAFASPLNQQKEQQSSNKDFLQMQSQSYQLPSTHSMHREWPQQVPEQHQQRGPTSSYSAGGIRQYSISAYAHSSPASHSSPAYHSSPASHSSLAYQSSPASHSSPISHSSPASQTSPVSHPSREFQAPYY